MTAKASGLPTAWLLGVIRETLSCTEELRILVDKAFPEDYMKDYETVFNTHLGELRNMTY
jgi:hypothetical protein